jgi:hypothetical protein
MERDRRWRFRISTLMLLVVVVALAIALVMERRNHERELQLVRAKAEADLAESKRRQAKLQMALQASYQALEWAKKAHPAAEATVAKAEKSKTAPGESRGRTEATGP